MWPHHHFMPELSSQFPLPRHYCRDAVHSGARAPLCAPAAQLHTRRPSAADWPLPWQAKARDGACKSAARGALGCARVGSFAVAPHSFVFAFVRDPLDRFVGTALAALSKPLNNCSNNWFHGRVCPHTAAMLRSLAASLLRSWPHRVSSLPLPDHWLTQSYFLAATDADGEPLGVRFLGKLETFHADFATLLGLLGHRAANASSLEHINQSGAARKKKAVRALVENDPSVMEAVCTIYAQDYACLGYPAPQICNRFKRT